MILWFQPLHTSRHYSSGLSLNGTTPMELAVASSGSREEKKSVEMLPSKSNRFTKPPSPEWKPTKFETGIVSRIHAVVVVVGLYKFGSTENSSLRR